MVTLALKILDQLLEDFLSMFGHFETLHIKGMS